MANISTGQTNRPEDQRDFEERAGVQTNQLSTDPDNPNPDSGEDVAPGPGETGEDLEDGGALEDAPEGDELDLEHDYAEDGEPAIPEGGHHPLSPEAADLREQGRTHTGQDIRSNIGVGTGGDSSIAPGGATGQGAGGDVDIHGNIRQKSDLNRRQR